MFHPIGLIPLSSPSSGTSSPDWSLIAVPSADMLSLLLSALTDWELLASCVWNASAGKVRQRDVLSVPTRYTLTCAKEPAQFVTKADDTTSGSENLNLHHLDCLYVPDEDLNHIRRIDSIGSQVAWAVPTWTVLTFSRWTATHLRPDATALEALNCVIAGY